MRFLLAASVLFLASNSAWANDSPGECSSGLCGTPNQSGGGGCGCGCGCGCSILIAMTDRGDTYQFADDFDGDGIEDEFDTCPFTSDYMQADGDGDGVGDACDSCVLVSNPLQENLDGDAEGDACDDDLDGDRVPNLRDACPRMPDAAQLDFDLDGVGDACDDDDDNDGLPDRQDDCRLGILGQGSACDDDPDGDGIDTLLDNCPTIMNPEMALTGGQLDSDGDGVGDACDLDLDGDAIVNARDNCPGVANPSQVDLDHDGLGDAGSWGAAAPESCDGHECYVVPGHAACLDPAAAFTIQITARNGELVPGNDVVLSIFTNRIGQLHSWSARFAKLPEDSNSSLVNARGSATTLDGTPQLVQCLRQGEEGRCAELNDVRFTPDEPGRYEVQVTVHVAGGQDPSGLGNGVATATATVEVGGESAGGCAAGAGGGLVGLVMALAMLAVLRRRR